MAEQYVHLAREDEDKTVCDLNLFDAESGVGVEATHRGPGRFRTVTCPACLHGEIRRLTEAHSEEARRLAAEARQYENYLSGHVYRVEAHRMVDGDVLETPVSILGDIHLDDDYWSCWDTFDEVAADMLPQAQPYSNGIDADMVKVVEWKS